MPSPHGRFVGTRASLAAWRSPLSPRATRIALGAALGLLLMWVAVELYAGLAHDGGFIRVLLGTDHRTYMDAVHRWLSGAPFYWPYQLAGPYVVVRDQILYPPIILPLLVVFSFLPDILWWVVPIGMCVGAVLYWRPRLSGWVAITACFVSPYTILVVTSGNPGIWIAAFVAAGTIWGWPAVLVALKPTLAPFMLVGIRRRSWSRAAALLAALSLGFLPLWFDWAQVVLNARGPMVSPLYSLQDVPLSLVPLLARLTTCRVRDEAHLPGPGLLVNG